MQEIFFDNAATSQPHARTLSCAQEFVEALTDSSRSPSDTTRFLRGSLVGAREKVAELIHCDSDEVALVQCTTHALGIIANAIPLEKGDNVLVCDLEYQASTACWLPRLRSIGAELRPVKSRNGRVGPEEFAAAMDAHTKAIMLASVQEVNGFRSDVKQIAALAHAHGCYIAIDGVQEVGVLEVDVHDLDVDFYCAGAKKWIGNPFGTGFLYIKREICQRLEPMYYGYFSMKTPDRFPDYISYLEDPSRSPFDDYGVINDATKFEIMGYANYIGAMGLREAIQVQLEVGPGNIEKNVKAMNRRLCQGLAQIGIQVNSPQDEAHMSGIAAFNFGFPNGNIQREKKLVTFLQERGIKVSLRSSTGTGGIRVSIHYYNTPEQVDVLIENIREFIRQGGLQIDKEE